MTLVYAAIVDDVLRQKKTSMSGQMTLFDLVSEEDKKDFEVQYPEVEEFPKEVLLGFEKEVLGIYLSGHPLEEYVDKMKKNITARAMDFVREEETGAVTVADNAHVVVGGILTGKTVKFTRNNKAMAFITVEDLTGAVEIIIFPKDYERFGQYLQEDAKIFVVGRATIEDEQNGKIICERIVPFESTCKEVWLQFADKEEYSVKEQELLKLLCDSDGADDVVIYVANPRAVKRLGPNRRVYADRELLGRLESFLGEKNVKLIEKSIENRAQ